MFISFESRDVLRSDLTSIKKETGQFWKKVFQVKAIVDYLLSIGYSITKHDQMDAII
jgi:hypothetical protein